MNDDELRQLVRRWQPGTPPPRLRQERVWQRLWRAEIRVPAPVALASALVLLIAALLLFSRPGRHSQQASPLDGFEPVSDLNARVVPAPAGPVQQQGGSRAVEK
jgi:hypothetical protein